MNHIQRTKAMIFKHVESGHGVVTFHIHSIIVQLCRTDVPSDSIEHSTTTQFPRDHYTIFGTIDYR